MSYILLEGIKHELNILNAFDELKVLLQVANSLCQLLRTNRHAEFQVLHIIISKWNFFFTMEFDLILR